MEQYKDVLNNKSYPKIRQGFAKYFELSESRGYINSRQRTSINERNMVCQIFQTLNK